MFERGGEEEEGDRGVGGVTEYDVTQTESNEGTPGSRDNLDRNSHHKLSCK